MPGWVLVSSYVYKVHHDEIHSVRKDFATYYCKLWQGVEHCRSGWKVEKDPLTLPPY